MPVSDHFSLQSPALYPLAAIRAIEHAAQTGLPAGTLMQRAGAAAAKLALELVPKSSAILLLAGPGNNGGDALEAAFHLERAGSPATVLLFADPSKQSEDARQACLRARDAGIRFADPASWSDMLAKTWPLIIDGLFGIGLARPISGDLRLLVEQLNGLRRPVLALDVPSGLNADTGAIVGPDGVALRASHTITFIGDKPGLHTGYGRDHAGTVRVESLAIDKARFPQSPLRLNGIAAFASALRPRAHNTHKGSFGDVSVAGGARGMGGAVILAARAAARCGAGRCFAVFLDEVPGYDSVQPELMCRAAKDHDFGTGTIVIGPGLGSSRTAHDLLLRALATDNPLVIDADALNLIAAEPGLHQKLTQRTASSVITPHPLEAARLLGVSSGEIQSDRIAAARELAHRFDAVVILKGSGSVIAIDDQQALINGTGNPALATAGTGDVLAGICGALLAQGWPAQHAACAAVWLHGRAADVLVERGVGPIGASASELIPMVRDLLNRVVHGNGHSHGSSTASG